MRKFECNDCGMHCKVTVGHGKCPPCFCVYDIIGADWQEVKEEACKISIQDNRESIQDNKLPDWCKVGAIGWNKEYQKYFEIIMVQHDMLIDVKNFDNTYSKMGYGIFCEQCNEARKRPFNADEMKALVGKIAEDRLGNCSLITNYVVIDNQITMFSAYCDAEKLMKSGYTIDGKPCFKLEHLNDKGEWVK